MHGQTAESTALTRADATYSGLVEAFLAHGRETPVYLGRFLAESPADPRAHATKALMLTLLARGELQPAASESAAEAARLSAASGRDSAFVEAASHAAHGAWWSAVDQFERAIDHDPCDTLAAKMSHAFRFMLGDKAGMLRSIERVLRGLPIDHPHRGFLLGCQAFALEENHDYARAELVGRLGVELEARDAWGRHAVSHVHEMTGRVQDGIRWIESSEPHFAHCNNFGGHLFWHLALFKLEAGAIADVFDVYDRRIRADQTDDFRDIANGASLLMRLELDGHDVGNRWEELADKAEGRLSDRSLVFADLHYLLALLGAGRLNSAALLARSISAVPPRHSVQAPVAARVGGAMAEGLLQFAQGDMGRALEALLSARGERVIIGGSDAQRDVFEQILIESALRSGETGVVRSILGERLAARGGHNRFASERLARLMRPQMQRKGAMTIVAALAFAAPMHD